MSDLQETSLSLADVEQIVRLVAQAGDPTVAMTLPERKRSLIEGVAKMVDADVYLWNTSVPSTVDVGDAMATLVIDGGWKSDEQHAQVLMALTDPEFAPKVVWRLVQAALEGRYVSMHRWEFCPDEEWEPFRNQWERLGLGHSLMTIYPISGECFSGIGLHRFLGRPPFTEREKAIVYVLFRQVDWLHRDGTHQPPNRDVINLSPRERQTMLLLLRGDTKRNIAAKLGLSEHTVGDYTKSIYRQFAVRSRGELQALFLVGKSASA